MQSTVEGPRGTDQQCRFCGDRVPTDVAMLARHLLICRGASDEARDIARTTLGRHQGLLAQGDPETIDGELDLLIAEAVAGGRYDPMDLMGGW